MWFWWFLLICDLFVPAIMIIAGIWMRKHYPRKINGVFGYRTPRSMTNMDTWRFAHEYCGKVWQKVGFITFLLTVIVHLPFYQSNEDTLGGLSLIVVSVQLIVLIASIFPTEKALKKTFHADGTRR